MSSTGTPRLLLRPGLARGAGFGYLLAWLVGLAVFMSWTSVTSSGADLLQAYRGHALRLGVQFVLTEGVAGLALAAIVAALVRWVEDPQLGRSLGSAGWTAAGISLVQCAIGVHLAAVLVPDGRAGGIGSASALLDRLDGVKMLFLAVTLVALALAVRRRAVSLPRWSEPLAWATALALAVSALGYLLLDDALALAAAVSLPLLLATMTAAAMLLARNTGQGPVDRRGDTAGTTRS